MQRVKVLIWWTPSPTRLVCQSGGSKHHSEKASVGDANTIGLDLAKGVFQAQGGRGWGRRVRKKLRRTQTLDFLSAQLPCTMAMEACVGAHQWGCEVGNRGHTVRLIPLSLSFTSRTRRHRRPPPRSPPSTTLRARAAASAARVRFTPVPDLVVPSWQSCGGRERTSPLQGPACIDRALSFQAHL